MCQRCVGGTLLLAHQGGNGMEFASWTCTEFVEQLASKAPVPGGGGASALVGAVGTALGNMVGALTVGKKKYYADPKTGALKAGRVKINKKYYYFSKNSKTYGELQTGWIKVGKKKLYAAKSGILKAGRVKINKKYYYFSKKAKTYGELQTGWIKVGKKKLYAKKSGVLRAGWVKINKKYYYFSKKAKTYGVMQTGKVKIGKKTYRFNKSGVCLDRPLE